MQHGAQVQPKQVTKQIPLQNYDAVIQENQIVKHTHMAVFGNCSYMLTYLTGVLDL